MKHGTQLILRYERTFLISAFLVLLVSSPLYAQDRCHFTTPNEYLSQVKELHPSILEERLRIKAQGKLTDIAKQRPNPALDAELLFGNPNSTFAADTFFSLQHTIEMGGKRAARIEVAKKEIERSDLQARAVKEEVVINVVADLHRVRQLNELTTYYKEAIESLDRIRKRLKKLPSRSPEQQVEVDTLELASNAYRFELMKKEAEKSYVEKHLVFVVGCDSATGTLPFPKRPTLPPAVGDYSDVSKSVTFVDAQKAFEAARARLKQEEALKVPNVSVGPAFGYGRSEGSNALLFGAALSMPIPLLNTNQGGRAYERGKLKASELRLKNVEREAKLDLELWKDRYERFYQSLSQSNTYEMIEKNHARIESLFRRGVVSTALIIEAHRQMIDFSQIHFSFELGAVESLWNIYRLTGRVEEGAVQ